MESGCLVNKQRYLLIASIGEGNNAIVWLAYNREDSKYYVIKSQYPEYYTGAYAEIEILSHIDHPRCIKLLHKFAVNCDEGKYICTVLPLCLGTIGQLLEGHRAVTLDVAKKWTRQILEGLAHVHSNDIVHTDIKPDNILLTGVSDTVQTHIDQFEASGFIQKSKRLKGEKLERFARECVSFIPEPDDSSEESSDSSEESSDDLGREQSVDDDTCYVDSVYDLDELYDWSSPITVNTISHESDAVIADFGNAMFMDELTENEIQDRLYRAPEIILDLPYDQTVDVWSVGCSVFEMLTGSYLMTFKDHEVLNDDIQQLYLLEKIIGPIPETLKRQSPRYDCLFDSKRHGEIRGVESHVSIGLAKHLSRYGITDSETVRFLSRLLSYEDRPTVFEVLTDPWLSS